MFFVTTNESPNVAIRWERLRLIASAGLPRRPLIADGLKPAGGVAVSVDSPCYSFGQPFPSERFLLEAKTYPAMAKEKIIP